MNSKQAFKLNLCVKLAAAGITPSEFVENLRKQAMDPTDLFGKLLGGVASTGQSAMGAGINAGVGGLKTLGTAALLAPAVIGAGAGIATEKMESPDPDAADSMQQAELIGLYRRLAKEVRGRKVRHNSERVV